MAPEITQELAYTIIKRVWSIPHPGWPQKPDTLYHYHKFEDGRLSIVFDDRYTKCPHCKDGVQYTLEERCPKCKGLGLVPAESGPGRVRCKHCRGNKSILYTEPKAKGTCNICSGKGIVPLGPSSLITIDDKQYIFDNLFDFSKPTGKQVYMGKVVKNYYDVVGDIDHGEYLKLTQEEFKERVRKVFYKSQLKYSELLANNYSKRNYLPTKIMIKKGASGWAAYRLWF